MASTPKSSMPVVILCGGQGTRLREETEVRPKPMVEIGGMPILWHILKIYSRYGFHDFMIACGYKAELIKRFFLAYRERRSDVVVDYVGSTPNAAALLDVSHSGGQTLSVMLLPEPDVLPALVVGVLAIAGLRLRGRGSG